MTEKLYYKDAYLRDFEGNAVEVRAEGPDLLIMLDKTAFYPEGGGQPSDRGTMTLPCGLELTVTDVQEDGKVIWHRVAADENCPKAEAIKGSRVHGKIDWERRFDHMQQHSGEHIVSGMICRRFGCDNVGFHLGEDTVTIDYNARIGMEELLKLESMANRYIWENHNILEMWPRADELSKIAYRSKKELEGDVRIISFPGADTCACCGTHVSSSAQVGLIKIISAKNFHEGTRIEMYCGKRAFDFLSMSQGANKETAVILSTSEENTPSRVQHLIDENIRLKGEISSLESRLLISMADGYSGNDNALIISGELSPEQGRRLADLISDRTSGLAAVFTKSEGGYRYALIRKGSDISDFVKEMNAGLKGRGGGRDGFASGSVNAGKAEIERFFESRS